MLSRCYTGLISRVLRVPRWPFRLLFKKRHKNCTRGGVWCNTECKKRTPSQRTYVVRYGSRPKRLNRKGKIMFKDPVCAAYGLLRALTLAISWRYRRQSHDLPATLSYLSLRPSLSLLLVRKRQRPAPLMRLRAFEKIIRGASGGPSAFSAGNRCRRSDIKLARV